MNDASIEAAAASTETSAVSLSRAGAVRRLWRSIALGPLEQRLFWIVFVGLLPLILLSFATLLYNAQAQKHEQIQTAENVEDNEDVRSGLRVLLEMDGHEVLEAHDGPSGVETVLRELADIALIDIGLPHLDGYGVARAIRSRAKHTVLLVAITGYGSKEDAQRGQQAGFDAYLVKPVDAAVLNELIARV
jgi:CheY-like chemotaxis protein